jgi:hypothetical protein
MGSRPFPLPSDIDGSIKHARPAVYLARAAAAHLRAFITKSTPDRAADQMFGRDIVTAEVIRAASTPATTTTTGWAKELAGVAIFDMVQSITSISAAADIISRGLKVNLDGIAEMRVPGRTLTAAAAGLWVAEGAPAPARALAVSNVAILRPRKLSVLYPYTREQAESSNIEAILRQTLGEAAAVALDAQMLSATAGDASKPGGVLVGVSAQTPTAGGGLTAMEGDLKNLFGALATNGAGKTAVIIAALPQAVTLKLTAGPKFDYDILASTALAAGTVIALETASFVSGFSSVPEFRVSNVAAFHSEDTSPADIVSGGSAAVPVKSLFQIDAIALKMDLFAAWAMRAANHVAYVTSVTW